MPRKRSQPQTDTDNKLARGSPTSEQKTVSPYFNIANNEEARESQGEEWEAWSGKDETPRARHGEWTAGSDEDETARTRQGEEWKEGNDTRTQGEERRTGRLNRRATTERISQNTSPATLPEPPLPSSAVSLPVLRCGSGRRLSQNFFGQECVTLAKALLGKVLVRVVGGQRLSARIVETEGYLGESDEASHSSGGKRTRRNEPMYMKPGTAYVYTIYGIYYCFNVSSGGMGSCVLVRAAEPLEGVEVMAEGRGQRRGPNAPPLKSHQLCNGPSKLCQALALTKETANKLDLCVSEELWVEEEEEEEPKEETTATGKVEEGGEDKGRGGRKVPDDQIVVTTRIGIESSGEESANKLLRFYVLGNKCVSVRNKEAEKAMLG